MHDSFQDAGKENGRRSNGLRNANFCGGETNNSESVSDFNVSNSFGNPKNLAAQETPRKKFTYGALTALVRLHNSLKQSANWGTGTSGGDHWQASQNSTKRFQVFKYLCMVWSEYTCKHVYASAHPDTQNFFNCFCQLAGILVACQILSDQSDMVQSQISWWRKIWRHSCKRWTDPWLEAT